MVAVTGVKEIFNEFFEDKKLNATQDLNIRICICQENFCVL